MKYTHRMIILIMLSLLCVIFLPGCRRYISKYKAIGFVHSNRSASAFMNFYEFEGCMVFRLKSKNAGQIEYSAKLNTGDITVYYDISGTKNELFSIHDGEETEDVLTLPEAGTVYILVQTDGKCQNGEFRFDIK